MGGRPVKGGVQRPETELAFVAPRLIGRYWAVGKNPRSGKEYEVSQPVDESGWDIGGGLMADALKEVVGDGKARISVAMDVGYKDFGRGAGCSVMVTLTHDQSTEGIFEASALAGDLACDFCEEHLGKAQALYDRKFGE